MGDGKVAKAPPSPQPQPPSPPPPAHFPISQTTLISLLTIFLLLFLQPTHSLSLNITSILSSYPSLSSFTSLLSTTISSDLTQISSVTILAVPNSNLSSSTDLTRRLSPTSLADVLRYHVLLQYLSPADFDKLPPSGRLITTLYQTTGRASSDSGSVNITRDPDTSLVTVQAPTPYSPSNATVLGLIKTLPYNLSIFTVNSLLIPSNFDLMASETRPALGLNITRALIDGHNFNVAASMLAASGVVEEFEADEGGAGITLFVPIDNAYSEMPASVSLQTLPADKKVVVLRYHVLHSYYPLGSLESIVNPVQPTLATESMGAGSYTLNISRVNGSVAIDTGLVQASVTQTVFDEKPVVIFGVSRVLLPKEIFGNNPVKSGGNGSSSGGGGGAIMSTAPPPGVAFSPENSPGFDGPDSRLSSPPGSHADLLSGVGRGGFGRVILLAFCIGMYVVI